MKKTMLVALTVSLFATFAASAQPAAETNAGSGAGTGPLVSGPVKGGEMGYPFGAYFGDIRNIGYVEEEYFIEGTAARYAPVDELGLDGKWNIESVSSAPYKTRILVRRPRDPAKFNGTVMMEWTNVSAGFDNSMCDPPGLYANGFAYVAVSAQPTGIDGFPSLPRGLKAWDQERYGSLAISDDAVSFDIFTQAAYAVGPERATKSRGVDPMGGLTVQKLIAAGASQSGSRVLAYTNGVQPLSRAFDALIPIICAGSASDFDSDLAHPDSAAGNTAHSRSIRTLVREDTTVPVLALNSQTEALFYARQRQDDTDTFRSWEVAGASHMAAGAGQLSRLKNGRDGMTNPLDASSVRASEVDWLYVFDAAVQSVHKWIHDGTPPPRAEPVQVSADGRDYVYDENGNVLGGIRLPELEVPAARYVAGPTYPLGGYTVPLSPARLKQLYPTHSDYVTRVSIAANTARDAGFILPLRVEEYIKAADAAPVPEAAEIELRTQNRATPEGRTTR